MWQTPGSLSRAKAEMYTASPHGELSKQIQNVLSLSLKTWPIMLVLFQHYGGGSDCQGLWRTIKTGQDRVFKDEQANKKKSVKSMVKGKEQKSNM